MKSSTTSSSSTAVGLKRLQKEYIAIQKQPVENITAKPDEKNIFEWHYCIKGPDDSCYKDGYYYGLLRFPPEYPFKPPAIMMITPNGRFKTNTRLCLSMSDFHPETWNPMWSVSSILSGLLSFMLDEAPTHGSITATVEQRQLLARASMESNLKEKQFVKMFPEIVNDYKPRSRNSRGESIISENCIDAKAKLSIASEQSESDVPVVNNEAPIVNAKEEEQVVIIEKKSENNNVNEFFYIAVLVLGFGIAVTSFILTQQQQFVSTGDASAANDSNELKNCSV